MRDWDHSNTRTPTHPTHLFSRLSHFWIFSQICNLHDISLVVTYGDWRSLKKTSHAFSDFLESYGTPFGTLKTNFFSIHFFGVKLSSLKGLKQLGKLLEKVILGWKTNILYNLVNQYFWIYSKSNFLPYFGPKINLFHIF